MGVWFTLVVQGTEQNRQRSSICTSVVFVSIVSGVGIPALFSTISEMDVPDYPWMMEGAKQIKAWHKEGWKGAVKECR